MDDDPVATAAGQPAQPHVLPAWRRKTGGEPRVYVTFAVLIAVVLQLVLPAHLGIRPKYLLPGLEAAVLGILVVANPGRFTRRSGVLRGLGVILLVLIIAANVVSAALLINDLLHSRGPSTNPLQLLKTAGDIYLTNIIAFGLLYWETDRGGPVARAHADEQHPDFLFPQMASPQLAPSHWEPMILDYLYLSLTNATAFSPTDTMPMTRTAKSAMGVQSLVSLIIVGLAVARVTNILK
ncbi:MAG: hypothetical protein NVS3B26_05960 [Mycobacteriales bacterium]